MSKTATATARTTMGGVTTYYIGAHFEWTGSTSTMVKYYYAGSQRVAMRVGSNSPSYLSATTWDQRRSPPTAAVAKLQS